MKNALRGDRIECIITSTSRILISIRILILLWCPVCREGGMRIYPSKQVCIQAKIEKSKEIDLCALAQ